MASCGSQSCELALVSFGRRKRHRADREVAAQPGRATEERLRVVQIVAGGVPVAHPRGYEIRGLAYWDGDVLAFDSTIGQEDQQATNAVRYHLSDDGRTLQGAPVPAAGETARAGAGCADWPFYPRDVAK